MTGCTDCNSNPSSYNPLGCTNNINTCNSNSIDSSNILYTGPNLVCTGVLTNTDLNTIILQIDSILCDIIGDYSTYNTECLSTFGDTDTQQNFVETISSYVCDLSTQITDIINVNIPAAISPIQTQINLIKNPALVSPCVDISYTDASTLNQVIAAQSNAICTLFSTLTAGLSSVDWEQCYSVSPIPTTIAEGFDAIMDIICNIQVQVGDAAQLPVFNNTGSCLASPGTSDTLIATISKIKTRLCLSPTFNAANLTSSTCVPFNSSSTLEQVINLQNSAITSTSQTAIKAVDTTQFTLVNVDNSNLCLGQKLTLNSSLLDRSVALNNADITPGNLLAKIAAGTNISLDFGTLNAGKLTISSTAGVTADEKVKITNSDPTPGYLSDKLVSTSTAYITTSIVPATASSLKVQADLNMTAVVSAMFDIIEDNEELRLRFCNIISQCPSPCSPPTNVQAVVV